VSCRAEIVVGALFVERAAPRGDGGDTLVGAFIASVNRARVAVIARQIVKTTIGNRFEDTGLRPLVAATSGADVRRRAIAVDLTAAYYWLVFAEVRRLIAGDGYAGATVTAVAVHLATSIDCCMDADVLIRVTPIGRTGIVIIALLVRGTATGDWIGDAPAAIRIADICSTRIPIVHAGQFRTTGAVALLTGGSASTRIAIVTGDSIRGSDTDVVDAGLTIVATTTAAGRFPARTDTGAVLAEIAVSACGDAAPLAIAGFAG
jgi:hypothetical protein